MIRSQLWILGGLLLATAAQAQSDQAQLTRPAGAADLNNHLSQLATNPRDVNALMGAGEAALALDDARAAAGFFARADAIQPNNGRVKAGLGRVMLKMQNPAEALRQFDQAARLGYPESTILADRGLARDMTGDQAGAQRDYQAALKTTPDDAELVRRYAASLGISGQVEAADRILQPLLYKSDRAAWRYNAFILAMNNRQAEAKKVVDQTMPTQLAAAIVPYMQKMPYLTAAQKAAAVHFGHFPTSVASTVTPIVPTSPAPGVVLASRDPLPTVAPPATATAKSDRRTRRPAPRSKSKGTAFAQQSSAAMPPAPEPSAPRTATPASVTPPPASPAVAGASAAASAATAPTPAQVQPLPASAASNRQPQMVQPLPGATPVSPTRSPAQSPTPQPVMTASAEVEGPPSPGFETVETARTPMSTAPAPTTGQAGAAAQLNAITLAQASKVALPAAPPAPPVQTVQAAQSAQTATAGLEPEPTPPSATAPETAAQQPDPEATRTLADIIHAIDVPASERQSSVVAVDLAEVEKMQAARRAARQAEADKAKKAAAAKAKAEADAKAKAEADEKKRLAANPSRNWVQIGSGTDKGALAFTLKNLRKKYDVVAPQDGWSASWGRTNRLLVGPFSNFTRAKAVEADLKKAGADAFAWQSDAGEVVEPLGGK